MPLRKRLFDILCLLSASAILAPLLIALSIGVWVSSGRPILYSQRRVGRLGRDFRILKFRTMIVGAESTGLGMQVAVNDPRITSFGRLLRRSGLDELPQVFNVLKGEMSLVGPRPTIPEQVSRYSPSQRTRLAMPPGITGLSQVRGRNTLSWQRRIALDVWYIRNWSLMLDFHILLKTPAALLAPEKDAYGIDGVTPDFRPKG